MNQLFLSHQSFPWLGKHHLRGCSLDVDAVNTFRSRSKSSGTIHLRPLLTCQTPAVAGRPRGRHHPAQVGLAGTAWGPFSPCELERLLRAGFQARMLLLRVPAAYLVMATTDLGTGTATDATLTSHFSQCLSLLLSRSSLLCLFAAFAAPPPPHFQPALAVLSRFSFTLSSRLPLSTDTHTHTHIRAHAGFLQTGSAGL